MSTPIRTGVNSILSIGAVGGSLIAAPYLLKFANPKTLLQTLTSQEFEALNNDDTKSEDKTEWAELVKKHISKKPEINKRITNINFTTNQTEVDQAENIRILKYKCREILNKTKYSEDDKATVIDWCNKRSKLLDANRAGSSSAGVSG